MLKEPLPANSSGTYAPYSICSPRLDMRFIKEEELELRVGLWRRVANIINISWLILAGPFRGVITHPTRGHHQVGCSVPSPVRSGPHIIRCDPSRQNSSSTSQFTWPQQVISASLTKHNVSHGVCVEEASSTMCGGVHRRNISTGGQWGKFY